MARYRSTIVRVIPRFGIYCAILVVISACSLLLAQEDVPAATSSLPSTYASKDRAANIIGHSFNAIVAVYGDPAASFDGTYGNPSFLLKLRHIWTCSIIYNQENGSLYLSFVWRRGSWVCFRSDWFPIGWEP